MAVLFFDKTSFAFLIRILNFVRMNFGAQNDETMGIFNCLLLSNIRELKSFSNNFKVTIYFYSKSAI